MRRSRSAALVLLLAAAVPAAAKFGISKTKVTLHRSRPPEISLLGDTVAVEVTATSRRVTDSQLARVRSRVEDAVRGWNLFHLADGPRGADSVVRVSVDDLDARIRETVEYEEKYVKIGEHQEWNEKKKKWETKSDWGNRTEPVPLTVATGSITARVKVDTPLGSHTADASASYDEQFKGASKVAAEARSEEALEQFLVETAATRAAAVVSFSPDPVEAMLAVDGDLKPGNRLAEAGLFKQALAEWTRKTFNGDKEAARLHNVGVAHEALAYELPPDAPEHRSELEQASEHYRKALALDPDEKYFAEPIHRVETSLGYAAGAAALLADRQRFEAEGAARSRHDGHAAAPAANAPAKVSASVPASTLRNGSFESALASWTLTGKGSVVKEAGRGMVLEVGPDRAGAILKQQVDVDVRNADASLSLAYRVASGEGRLRVLVVYGDSAGRERTSSLEVTAGEGPGDWSDWSGDLAGLRPRPARLREIRVAAEGGVLRLDNLALTVR
jgi:tetratricopeptide (TPR) repeat protein